MSSAERALIVVGSPKPGSGASASLATYVAERLGAEGLQVETVGANRSLRSEQETASLLTSFDDIDVIVLVFPLYIDCLPAGLIKLLELLAEHRSRAANPRPQRMLAVCQNGFPDARQNQTALAICRRFCQEAGITWAGGLAMGAGHMVTGRDLKQMGRIVRNITKAFDLACADLAAGRPVCAEAVELMAKPAMPVWLYLLIASRRWKSMARENGVVGRMGDKPYAA